MLIRESADLGRVVSICDAQRLLELSDVVRVLVSHGAHLLLEVGDLPSGRLPLLSVFINLCHGLLRQL